LLNETHVRVMNQVLIENAKKMASKPKKTTISMTFCECGENDSNGMEKIGIKAEPGQGLNLSDLKKGARVAKKLLGVKAKIVALEPLLDGVNLVDTKGRTGKVRKGWVMRIKGFVNAVLKGEGKTMGGLFKEMNEVHWDGQYWNKKKKKIETKRARTNNCVADVAQEANINEGKGTIHAFNDLPSLNIIREMLYKMFGHKVKLFIAEGNRYEDGGTKKHGIGWHGDAERRIVACIRLMPEEGETMPMHFHYFWQWKQVGKRLVMDLNAGDLYVMSEEAVGSDWLKKSLEIIPRHATGANKFTKDKVPKKKAKKKVKKSEE
jgi:hypothetical protein